MDVELQQAQQQLSRLGYDAGEADGVYGPRTRQALEAFQHMQGLPVTGILDEATRQGLESAVASTAVAPPPPEVLSDRLCMWCWIICDSMSHNQGACCNLVTEHFLNGVPPQAWIEQTIQTRLTRALTYVAWKVQGVETVDEQATVRVHTWVRVHGQEQARAEIFTFYAPWKANGSSMPGGSNHCAKKRHALRPGRQSVQRMPSLEGACEGASQWDYEVMPSFWLSARAICPVYWTSVHH